MRSLALPSREYYQDGLSVRSSSRHASLNSRNGSMARLFIMSRSSGKVLFGEKYVSTIILTTVSCFSTMRELDVTRILLMRAYTLTSVETSDSLWTRASAYDFDASTMNQSHWVWTRNRF